MMCSDEMTMNFALPATLTHYLSMEYVDWDPAITQRWGTLNVELRNFPDHQVSGVLGESQLKISHHLDGNF